MITNVPEEKKQSKTPKDIIHYIYQLFIISIPVNITFSFIHFRKLLFIIFQLTFISEIK